MVGFRDSYWLQLSMNVLIGLFCRYDLTYNVTKSGTMTYQPSALRSGMTKEAKELKCKGLGASYRERLRRHIPFPDCGVKLTAGLMTAYQRLRHGTGPAIEWNQLLVSHTDNHPQVYYVSLPWKTNL